MFPTVLTLCTPDGEHRISCPRHSSLTLGSAPECEIMVEGAGILPRHCTLYRTGDRTFQIVALFAAAKFSVNGVISSELEVEVPFKFGIGGEVFELGLATEEEAPLHEAGEAAQGAGPRSSRRSYLLKPVALKPRAGQRVGEVILEGVSQAEEETPVVSRPAARPTVRLEAADETASKPDEEESSSLLLTGLVVCGAMIAGIVYWPHHLDQMSGSMSAAAAEPVTAASSSVAAAIPELTPEATVQACAGLLHAEAPVLASHVLMPLAEAGNVEAMHHLALALRASGEFGDEVVFLLRQAVEGGSREALRDFVRVVDDEDNPARYTEGTFQGLQLAVKLGETSAWMPLGERYEYGNGTDPDIKRALAAFEKARAVGDSRADAKLSAKQAALERVAAFVRSWNEVSVATLLDHAAAGQGKFFLLDHPAMDVVLRLEEEMRARWPLRRISVAAGAKAEVETFDLIKVSQPFQFEVQRGVRVARGTGVLACTVQRDVADVWRITEADDRIEAAELLPAKDQFVSAASLRALKPAFTPEEKMQESRLEILEKMRGIEDTQDFEPALAVVLGAVGEFPQEAFWRPFADALCDRMARQLFAEGQWLDAAWAEPVHQLAERGSVSAMLLEGHLLAAGYGRPRDPARSAALYQKAFENGQRRDARFYYAEALFQGRGVPQDVEKAGALVLSFMSRSNHPLEAYLAAHLLWRKAESDPSLWQQVYDTLSRVVEKHPPAKNLAGMVLLNHGQTTKERKTGFAAIKAAAEEGVVEAMKNLANCYQEGIGCEKDFIIATTWKQKAAVTPPPRRKHYTEFEE
jgi:TPR repeat protein